VRKPLYIATTVIFLSILAFPQTALAEDDSESDSGWEQIFDSGQEDSGDLKANKPDKPAYDPSPKHKKPDKPAYDPSPKHKKLEDQYGEVDQVGVPQIVIRPGVVPDPSTYELPIVPAQPQPTPAVSSLGEVEDTSSPTSVKEEAQEFVSTQLGITLISPNEKQTLVPTKLNPAKGDPIQIKDLILTKKTPADEFLDGAIYFGEALALLALLLLGLTGLSALRLRRESKEH